MPRLNSIKPGNSLNYAEQRSMSFLRMKAFGVANNWRHHDLTLFFPENQSIQIAKCRRCGAEVQVILYPKPNEINIGGEAVALTCGGR